MEDNDSALEKYSPGDPILKPDVAIQMKEIEAKRDKMIEDAKKRGVGTQVVVKQPDGTERTLTQPEIIQLLQKHQEELRLKNERLQQMEQTMKSLREELSVSRNTIARMKQERIQIQDKEQTDDDDDDDNTSERFVNIPINVVKPDTNLGSTVAPVIKSIMIPDMPIF